MEPIYFRVEPCIRAAWFTWMMAEQWRILFLNKLLNRNDTDIDDDCFIWFHVTWEYGRFLVSTQRVYYVSERISKWWRKFVIERNLSLEWLESFDKSFNIKIIVIFGAISIGLCDKTVNKQEWKLLYKYSCLIYLGKHIKEVSFTVCSCWL